MTLFNCILEYSEIEIMLSKTILYTINFNDVQKHRQRIYARRQLTTAIKQGVLERSITCEMCYKKSRTSGHHVDYGKPLEVIWLCSKCHGKAHTKAHALNPDNNPQTPLEIEDTQNNYVIVTFTIPVKNYIAFKAQCQQLDIPIASRVRQLVIDAAPLESNQLKFNFENNDDKTRTQQIKGICSMAANETEMFKQKIYRISKNRRTGNQNEFQLGERFFTILRRHGAHS